MSPIELLIILDKLREGRTITFTEVFGSGLEIYRKFQFNGNDIDVVATYNINKFKMEYKVTIFEFVKINESHKFKVEG